MFHKLSIFFLSLFLLAGNFKNLPFINSLPIDLSILAMIIPFLYFIYYSVTRMRISKSFFVISGFGLTTVPTLLLQENSTEKIIFFLLIFLVLTIVSPVILRTDYSKEYFIRSLLFISLILTFLPLLGLGLSGPGGRLTLNGGNPIGLARAVSIAGIILIIRLFYNKVSLLKSIVLVTPVVYVLLATGSKGPFFSMVIAILIVYLGEIRNFLLNRRFITKLYPTLIVGVTAFIYIYLTNPGSPVSRLFNLNTDSSTFTRVLLYRDSLSLISKNPMGIGLGNFQQYSIAEYPHNAILEAIVELGWIPGLFFTSLLIISFIGWRKLSRKSVSHTILYAFFIMSFANAMFTGDLTSPKELYLLLPIGLNAWIVSAFDIQHKNQPTKLRISNPVS